MSTFQFCTPINAGSPNVDDTDASSDVSTRESSIGSERGLSDESLSGPAPTEIMANLLKISNYASALCVLDCTILPFVTIVLPLFGTVAASPAQMEWMHEAGHTVALYFVLPVGGLATTTNYCTSHRNLWILALGWMGMLLILGANAGCHFAHDWFPKGGLWHILHDLLHMIHHGIIHRITNLGGCSMLLASNYLSHRFGSCLSGPDCKEC